MPDFRREPTPEWKRMAEEEPYRIGARLNSQGTIALWFVADCRDDDGNELRRFKSREAAIKYADQMNAEHRRRFR